MTKAELRTALGFVTPLEMAAAAAIKVEVGEDILVVRAFEKADPDPNAITTPSIEIATERAAGDDKGEMAPATAAALDIETGGKATYKGRLATLKVVISQKRGESPSVRELEDMVALALDPLMNCFHALPFHVGYLAAGDVEETIAPKAIDQAVMSFPLKIKLNID